MEIKNLDNIYHELAMVLHPYREEKKWSIEFIVEGDLDNPVIGIKYPGKKVKKRKLKRPSKRTYPWENLYDFKVIPYIAGKPKPELFTFDNILHDFETHKKDNEEFWELIVEMYEKNKISSEPPKLSGIHSKLFLLTLKWLWILEDLNYKYNYKEVNSPVKYKLKHKGVGRTKSYAALILIKDYFSHEEVRKIIPIFG
ncbi:MAG: hypothetical protein GF308_11010 [Candidatus Heimdallarchaeota archaeon]|nr:hypothetical protein [Candidatus Heimdallarchaeota archaeon]